jgi:hypothetical protein
VPKQIVTVTLEGIRKRGRPGKRRGDEVEEVLNIIGTKNRQAMTRDRRELGKISLEGKAHNGLQLLRRKKEELLSSRT